MQVVKRIYQRSLRNAIEYYWHVEGNDELGKSHYVHIITATSTILTTSRNIKKWPRILS
jgi:hypothetical protein